MGAADYSEAERARGQRVMVVEGAFARAMEGVTSGVILAGFALALGATDLEIGLLAAIPFLAQLAHIPAVGLLGRFADRKPLAVGAAVLARLLFFAIALVPFVAAPVRPVTAVIVLLVAYATVATFSGAAWQVWVREMVPRERLGAYFGKRMAVLSAVGLVTLVAAGQFTTWWRSARPEGDVTAFAILFALGGALGVVSALILRTAPSRASVMVPNRRFPQSLRAPLEDLNYRRVLVFLGAWGFAANLALPFVSIVLLRSVGYPVATVTLLAALSLVANIGGLRLWSPLTDRFGNKPVMALSASLFLVTMLLWSLWPKVDVPATFGVAAVVHVLMGFALAGLDLAGNGLVMKLSSEEDMPSYLASASVVRALATGVAPLLAGGLATLLAGRAFSVRLAWTYPGGEQVITALRFAHYDFLFLLSVLLGLYAIHRLLGFREEGEAPQEEVVRAMRREIPQVSSVAGMRAVAHAASYLVEAAYLFERSLDVRRAGGHDDEPPRPAGPPP